MPFIGNGRMLEDGSIFTSYQGTAWNQIQTYYFTGVQDGIYVKNVGQNDLTINGNVLKVGQFLNMTNISQFTAVAVGRESFEVQAWSGGPVNSATEAIKALYKTPAGRKWLDNVAENQRDGKATNVVCAIDSLTASNSYLDSARDLLQNYMGNGGPGFVAFNLSATTEEGISYGIGAGGTSQTNAGFAAGTDSIYNPNLYSLTFTAASNAQTTMAATQFEFDSVDVFALQKTGGGTVVIRDQDAATATPTTINTAGATKVLVSGNRVGWTAGKRGNRLRVDATGAVQMMGVNFKRGTTGIRMHRAAQPGSKASQLALVDPASYAYFLQTLGCDLYILLAGMNDAGDTPAVYDANMRKILDNVKAANPKSAILILAMNETDTPSKNVTLQTYIDKYQQLAADYNAMVWDERLVLGTYAQALANGWMQDGTHPNAIGSNLRGEAIVKFLGGTALADVMKALTA